MKKFTLTHYYDRNGVVGDIKDIEDSPMYDGFHHKEFEAEMKNREKLLSMKQIRQLRKDVINNAIKNMS